MAISPVIIVLFITATPCLNLLRVPARAGPPRYDDPRPRTFYITQAAMIIDFWTNHANANKSAEVELTLSPGKRGSRPCGYWHGLVRFGTNQASRITSGLPVIRKCGPTMRGAASL
jgi:hypothetical protein